MHNFYQKKSYIDYLAGKYDMPCREALDFYNIINDNDNDSNFIFLLKNKTFELQLAVRINELDDFLKISNTRELNIYTTANTFDSIKRYSNHVFNINALYVDIDCHLYEVNEYMIRDLINILESEYFNSKIPYPTLIISTGRGVQLYWKIKSAPKQALKYWKWVENKIIDVFQDLDRYTDFQVDRKVKDINRLLRLPGSYNLKSNSQAKIIEMRVDNVFTLDEIKEGYIIYEEFKQIDSKNLRLFKNNYLINGFNSKTYAEALTDDLEKICELRNYDLEGNREFLLWLYRMNLLQFKSYTESNHMVNILNNKFKKPLSLREVDRATIFRKNYQYKTKTLIEQLAITQDEQKELSLLINREEKNRRKREKYYAKNGSKIDFKREKKKEYIKQAKKLNNEGKSIREIAQILEISKSSVGRFLKFKDEEI